MAMPSATATGAYTRTIRKFSAAPNTRAGAIRPFNHAVNFASKRQQQKYPRFVARSSDEYESSEAAVTETATATEEKEEGNAIEVPKGPPSLISALNVEKALRGIPITDADHYATLGIQRGCPYEQVEVAYKAKVDQFTGQGLEEEELNKKLDELKESYTILSSEQERRLYDWSLERSDRPDRYMWPYEADITQTPKGTPPPQFRALLSAVTVINVMEKVVSKGILIHKSKYEPEDVGPTRLVGYFIAAWLILGFTLSIALNR